MISTFISPTRFSSHVAYLEINSTTRILEGEIRNVSVNRNFGVIFPNFHYLVDMSFGKGNIRWIF